MKKVLAIIFICFLSLQVSAYADFFNEDPNSYLFKDYWNYSTTGNKVSLTDNNNRLEGASASPSQLSGAGFRSTFSVSGQNDFSCKVDFYSSYYSNSTKGGMIGIGFENVSDEGIAFTAADANGYNAFLAIGNHSSLSAPFMTGEQGEPYYASTFKGTLFVDYTASNKTFNFSAKQDYYGTINTINLDPIELTDEMASDNYFLSLALMADPSLNISAGNAYLENFQITQGAPTLPIASPEPLSATLFLLGGAGLVVARRRKKSRG